MTKKSLHWIVQKDRHLYVDSRSDEVIAEIARDWDSLIYIVNSHYLSFSHKFMTFESAKAYTEKTIPND